MKNKILIVDDDPVIKMSLEAGLQEAGYTTENVADGQKALEKIDEIKPDIILSDIIMPNLDGYELHNRLRQNPKTADIPFIFLSVKDEPSEQLKGLQLGADDYVTKPFKINDLVARIKRVLSNTTRARSFQSQADFSGNFDQVDIADVLSIIELNCKNGELVLRSSQGKSIGTAFFRNGKLINALKEPLTGEEAFLDLVAEDKAYYDFFGREITIIEQIKKSNMSVLLGAKILIDEGNRLDQFLPDLDLSLKIKGGKIPEKIRKKSGNWHLEKILRMIESRHSVRRILYSGIMSRIRTASILCELLEKDILVVAENRKENRN